jgi:PleD family two-component response regulator
VGGMLALQGSQENRRFFMVNSAPIMDEVGQYRGALASFEDVTELQENRAELLKMLDALRQSRDEIHTQNEELQFLATRDPLTSCLNRRTFFEQFEFHWKLSTRYKQALSCIVVDLDCFKSINDTYGHGTGDA